MNQLKAILQLRWQLTRNQWSRHGARGVIAILIGIAALVLGLGCFVGGFLVTAFGMRTASSDTIMRTWFFFTAGFLMFWLLGLLTELQRSEAIDLQQLMHLPVRLGQIFLLNYAASHFTFSLILAVPAIFGLSIGLTVARGPIMLLMLPLALSMIAMITAWSYCLRGWLTALMTNPRRRRSIVVALTFAVVVMAQLPNIYFNVFSRPGSRRQAVPMSAIPIVQKFVPPFWISIGAKSLVEGETGPALLEMVGCAGIAALGLHRAYRSTLKFYHGEDKTAASPAARQENEEPRKISRAGGYFLERRLPGFSDETSAVALASLRSMSRAPEIKMALAMSLVLPVVIGVSIIFRNRMQLSQGFKPFLAPMVIAFSLFTLVQFLSNQFGFDREGFQTFVLSPLSRRALVLGKNLAALPILICFGLFWIVLINIFVGLPALTTLAAIFQLTTMALIAALFGNVVSICLPYRVRATSLKPTKISGARGLFIMLTQMLFPFLLLPIFIAPIAERLFQGSGFPINLTVSFVFALLALCLYFLALPSLGNLLQQRETKILDKLTTEPE